jgi:hypothetical protein
VYARAKVPELARRWRDVAFREATARFGAHYLPNTPTTALIASGATSTGPAEHGGPPDYATGYYGVEWQWWLTVANDDETRRILGRAGPTDLENFARDNDAQAFAGMRTYARHLTTVSRQLAAGGRPQLAAGDAAWKLRLATSAYSAGPSTVSGTIIGALTDRVATGATWRELAAGVAHECPSCAARVGRVACCGRWHASDVVVRSDARWECGLGLAQDVAPAEVGFYAGSIVTAAERTVVYVLTDNVNGV